LPPANYPREQMHRIKYTNLTPERITQKLAAAASGPVSEQPLSEELAGKAIRIVTDDGPMLEYRFDSRNALTLTEGESEPAKAGYGALALEQLILFSHMMPDSQRGYHVVIDQETQLATVFEVWFSGYRDNREVQRQIHYGYIEQPGQEAPTARHHITNRLEGKGFYWKQNTGIETLEFYPSVLSSSFVELTRLGGELTFCAPSDFIKIDDQLYIYARVECEFSGTMTLYLIDLFSIAQAGVRLGFDETDTLEYYLFTGKGEITGQIATFEPLDDYGETIAFGDRPMPTGKGARPVYRPLLLHPPMTGEEVDQAVRKEISLFDPNDIMAGNRMPLSDYLVGKQLTVRYDNGPVLEYRFDEIRKLRWRREGESQWHEETYEAFEPADRLILFGHLHGGARPPESAAIALDFAQALTTIVDARMGTKYAANEASLKIYFGVIEMDGLVAPRYDRHQFTDELVGRAVTWNYSDAISSLHVYSSPHSCSWSIFLPNGAAGMQWSAPANYVKLRDDCYLFTWAEEACNGSGCTIVFNTSTMHDCGYGFSVNHEHLNLNVMGAYARNAGYYDIKKYFGPK
jgi:molybdenum cofactor biosynthesis protein MoaF